MNTIEVNKIERRTNYTGLEEGAEPVHVYRTAKFVVVHVGEPVPDKFFNNQEFRQVKFVELDTSKVFVNTLYQGHYSRLESTLVEGNVVEIKYQTDTGWIRSINGKEWN